MKRAISALALIALSLEAVVANSYRPRTLDEKVADAELIVFGTASAFGDKDPPVPGVTFPGYQRKLRVKINEVLWPPSFTNESEIVFPYFILETWPKSWWDYNNTPGVFFLKKSEHPDQRQWDQLELLDNWMEPATNALAVLLSVQRQKGKPGAAGQLRIPGAPFPQTTAYDYNSKVRWEYLISFRDGYYDAFARKCGLLMFGPTNEVDKAKVIGYQEGQLAGEAARSEWTRKLHLWLKSNAVVQVNLPTNSVPAGR